MDQAVGASITETGQSSILLLGNRSLQNSSSIGFVHDQNAELKGAADVTRAHTGVVELTPEIGVSVLVELRSGISQGVDLDVGGRQWPIVTAMAYGENAVAFTDHGIQLIGVNRE